MIHKKHFGLYTVLYILQIIICNAKGVTKPTVSPLSGSSPVLWKYITLLTLTKYCIYVLYISEASSSAFNLQKNFF